MIDIRFERKEDHEAIYRVNQLAFGRPNEADLVDALRELAHPSISLVAESDERIVGHIFFSPVSIESETSVFEAMGLAPMAVLPENQNQGIGTRLVREGLKECKAIGHDIVFVLGHPRFYPRFGFAPAASNGLRSEYDVPVEVFMVAELNPGALGGRGGRVRYHSAFANV